MEIDIAHARAIIEFIIDDSGENDLNETRPLLLLFTRVTDPKWKRHNSVALHRCVFVLYASIVLYTAGYYGAHIYYYSVL